MADISKITLPSNVTYDVKDTTARSGLANKQDKITAITAQTTQAVYPIKIDSQGHITAYGSAVTSMAPTAHTHPASQITDGYTAYPFYINTHPENSPTVIPFINNDIAHLLKRGGSAILYHNGTIATKDMTSLFDGSGSYFSYSATDLASISEIIIEMTLYKTFTYTNTFYIDFGNAGWRAKTIKFEVMNTNYSSDVWTQKGSVTNYGIGEWKVSFSHTPVGASNTGGGFNKLRVTLSNWNSTQFRISQIGIINYGSSGLRETYMSRGVDDYVFRNITPNTNNAYSLGSSSLKWKDIYSGTLNGTTIPASPKFTDTTYGANRGISNVSGNFGHSNTAITAQNTQAVYPIKIDAYGHITGYGSAVTIPAAVAVKGNSESTYRTGNVNLTAANIGAAASSHAHGDITSGGDITATATIASGDRLVINDESASKITNSSITFGTSTTTFLRNNGTWGTVDSGTSVYDGYGYAPSKYESLYLDTIASGTGTGVDMKPTIDLLWTNSAPTSAFAGQTISMNLSEYRWFIIETVYTTSYSTRQYGIAAKNEETVITNNQARNQTRHFTFTNSGVTISAGTSHTGYNNTNSDSTQNSYILPIKIFGIK